MSQINVVTRPPFGELDPIHSHEINLPTLPRLLSISFLVTWVLAWFRPNKSLVLYIICAYCQSKFECILLGICDHWGIALVCCCPTVCWLCLSWRDYKGCGVHLVPHFQQHMLLNCCWFGRKTQFSCRINLCSQFRSTKKPCTGAEKLGN